MKTKLSRAILLASVALLSVVGAAVAFSTNRTLNSQLVASDVEALADWEGFVDWLSNKCYDVEKGNCTVSFSSGVSYIFETDVTTTIPGTRYYCLNVGYGSGAFAHCPVDSRLCLVPGITRNYEMLKAQYESYYALSHSN